MSSSLEAKIVVLGAQGMFSCSFTVGVPNRYPRPAVMHPVNAVCDSHRVSNTDLCDQEWEKLPLWNVISATHSTPQPPRLSARRS